MGRSPGVVEFISVAQIAGRSERSHLFLMRGAKNMHLHLGAIIGRSETVVARHRVKSHAHFPTSN